MQACQEWQAGPRTGETHTQQTATAYHHRRNSDGMGNFDVHHTLRARAMPQAGKQAEAD